MYRAIIVDDIPIICTSIARQVNESASPVLAAGIAANGGQALEWLQEHYADICITDIRMPVVDGLELIKKVRENYPWMASLVISSFDEFSYAQKSVQLEAVDYILKPVEQENLDAGLKKAVERLEKSRTVEAASILLAGMSTYGKLLEKWAERLKLSDTISSSLIDETGDAFRRIAGGKHYLLEYMSIEWLSIAAAELKLEKPDICFQKADRKDAVPKSAMHEEAEEEHRSACARILEEGMKTIAIQVSAEKGTYHSKLVESIISFIGQNYLRKDLTLQELAEYGAVSKNHMANLFKQETGMTVWNYIVTLRMKKAGELLQESSMKNYEIALSVGYEDYTYFSQLFKEHYGVSPAEYKKRISGR